jgi:hypothetical protein
MNSSAKMATDRALGSFGLNGSKNHDFAIFMLNAFNAEFWQANKVIYSHK